MQLRRRTQVKIDYTQLAVMHAHSGNDRVRQRETDPRKPAGSTQCSISLGTGRCVALRSRRDSSQQDRLEHADRREAQIERASRLERGRRAVAQLQESRDTLLDGTPEQKALSHKDAEHQPHSGSKSRTSQTDTWRPWTRKTSRRSFRTTHHRSMRQLILGERLLIMVFVTPSIVHSRCVIR